MTLDELKTMTSPVTPEAALKHFREETAINPPSVETINKFVQPLLTKAPPIPCREDPVAMHEFLAKIISVLSPIELHLYLKDNEENPLLRLVLIATNPQNLPTNFTQNVSSALLRDASVKIFLTTIISNNVLYQSLYWTSHLLIRSSSGIVNICWL